MPALILLAITTAGTVDPPSAGLLAQLHVSSAVPTTYPAPTGPAVTPR